MIHRNDSEPGRRGPGIALAALVILAIAPGVARASEPQITVRPTITGTAQVGQLLSAGGHTVTGKPTPRLTWQWWRCDASLDRRTCRAIAGATTTSYTLTVADQGKRVAVVLTAENKDGEDETNSDPTGVVAAAPAPTPAPTPGPTATPTASPEPPVSDPEPPATAAAPLQPIVSVPQGAVLPAAAVKPPAMMRPAPVVRIGGRLSRAGARITLLTVQAPRGARITLRCLGRGCPARRWAHTSVVTRILRFQRDLRAGIKLIITVTKPGRIGKHTTILIRYGKPPARRDRCLLPGSRRPVKCEEPAT